MKWRTYWFVFRFVTGQFVRVRRFQDNSHTNGDFPSGNRIRNQSRARNYHLSIFHSRTIFQESTCQDRRVAITVICRPINGRLNNPFRRQVNLIFRRYFVLYRLMIFPWITARPPLRRQPREDYQRIIIQRKLSPSKYIVVNRPAATIVRVPNYFNAKSERFPSRSRGEFLTFQRVNRFNQPMIRFYVSVSHVTTIPN